MSSRVFLLLSLLLVFHLLTVSGKRPKPKPKKYCKGPNGEKYKIGQSYKDDCALYTCRRKGRRAAWSTKLLSDNCCDYKGVIVPNGFQEIINEGNSLISISCVDGVMEKSEIPAPPEELFTDKINNETAAEDLIKLMHGGCHSSHAIATDGIKILGLHPKVSSRLLGDLTKESDRVLSEKEEWVCGISRILSLIQDEDLKKEVSNLLPPELAENTDSVSESDDKPQQKIIGGIPAGTAQIPWQALIMRVFPWGTTSWGTRCGGVLIHSCYVLTARHCTAGLWNPSQDMSIILGDVNVPPVSMTPGSYTGPGQERHVMYVHYHPDPNYDVALILLKSSSSVNPSWNPIIKPIKIADFYPPADSTATVSGYGWTTSGSGPSSSVLNFAQVEVPSFSTCQNYWPTIGASWLQLAAHEICAGGYNPYVGACHRDSGGPLTQADPVTSEPKLIGLVERGIGGCPTNMKYAVYVNPSFPAIKGWIDAILPTTEPTGNMGHGNGTGKPCACLRPAITYTGQPTNAYHFGNINNRNCLLKAVDYSSSCGTNSPNIPITIQNPPMTGLASPYTCWANAGVPWSQDCSIQFPFNGKMYLEPWNPYDCPLELDPVPEYTHAYVASYNPNPLSIYMYGYAKQEFTDDVNLNAEACFSPLSMVTLSSGQKVSVSEIKIGDILQTVDSNKKLVNSPFLGWLHKDRDIKTFFLDIITEDNSFVSLSPLHLILTTKSPDQGPIMKFARSVAVGDYLVSPHSKSLLKVTSISRDIRQGVYSPLTETGTILVDGLVASCYAHIQSHELAHFALLPVRLMPRLLEDRNSQHKDGIRTYLEYLMKFAEPLVINTKEEIDMKELSFNSIATGFLASLSSICEI